MAKKIAKRKLFLPDRLAIVLGTRALDRSTIVEALRKRGWLPDSANATKYVGETLSREPMFECLPNPNGREGLYRVKQVKVQAAMTRRTKTPRHKGTTLAVDTYNWPGLHDAVKARAKSDGKTVATFVAETLLARLAKTSVPGKTVVPVELDDRFVPGLTHVSNVLGKTPSAFLADALAVNLAPAINQALEAMKVPVQNDSQACGTLNCVPGNPSYWCPTHGTVRLVEVAPRKNKTRVAKGKAKTVVSVVKRMTPIDKVLASAGVKLSDPDQSAYRADRKAKGLCRDCNAPAVKGQVFCPTHKSKNALSTERSKAKHAVTNGVAAHPATP